MATPDSTWLLITGISVGNCLCDILSNAGALRGVFPSLHLRNRVLTSSFMNRQQQQQQNVTTCNHDAASDLSSVSGSNFRSIWQRWTLNEKCPELILHSTENLGGVFHCKLTESNVLIQLKRVHASGHGYWAVSHRPLHCKRKTTQGQNLPEFPLLH